MYTREAKNQRGRSNAVKYIAGFLLAAGLFVAVGCASIGPGKLVPTHEGYNDAVQLTVTREVLKNIVRERYLDAPQFITVSAINAQFSVSAGASVTGAGIGTGNAAAQAGGNVGYSDSPTITFVPQTGAGAWKSMAAPVGLPDAISYMLNWGRVRPHEIALVIGSINQAQDRPGPRGEAYVARMEALTRLFERGATVTYFREFQSSQYAPISKDSVDGRAFADAAAAGVAFHDTDDGMLRLGKTALTLALVVPLPHEGQTEADLRLLGLAPGKSLYPIRPPGQARPEQLGTLQPDTLWLTPRSVANMLELSTLSVDVPPEHQQKGLAPSREALLNSGVTLPMKIRSSSKQPNSMYRIQHRGYWFYVDDTDMMSKHLFMTIVLAYASRIGLKAPDSSSPQIVLPIGGG